ncbi:MAG: succinate dehydrogenase / fumarate reductase, iron-sulfur subunit [Candidatus Sumerlaeota bacterium]|nr:succinate dehydrogenase / fumarate reductase, iron-sulfur subunit [Candidatus Sumerlaeota bacterium]
MASSNGNDSSAQQTVTLRIKRQKAPGEAPYWETFKVPYERGMNVISALMKIRLNPETAEGRKTTPVTWDAGCLEEVCGACSMRINGIPRQSCTALIDNLEQPIVLEPFSKFPVIRDLMVDRTPMFESLKRVKAWVPVDGTYHLGPAEKISPEMQQIRYKYSECMTCGCCLEACPQYNGKSAFIGASVIGQSYLFNAHPTGKNLKGDRLDVMMGVGGVVDCGNAQNCVRVCPKGIPLTDAIAAIGGQVTIHAIRKMLHF